MQLTQILLSNTLLVCGAMLLLWLLSLRQKDASIVDIFWGLGFILIAWSTFLLGEETFEQPRAWLLVMLTTIWGFRLSGYIAWRNHGRGEDARYTEMRNYRGQSFWWVSLFTVFALQGAIMWLVSLPVQVGQLTGAPLTWVAFVGVAFWIVGFLFESIGDFQLARFKADADNKGRVMDRGLWRYTRHPNYFGNAMLWWGLFLIAASGNTFWLVISPIVMTFLLLKVSGVALLERDMKSRSQEYRDYTNRTSSFIPWPPCGARPVNGPTRPKQNLS